MKDKIVFFDIDGTLLDHEKKLPLSTKNAIEEIRKKGIHVAIATGRGPFMFEELRNELGINSYVSFNGQYVVFENEVIYKNPLNKVKLRELNEFTKKNQHPLVFLNEIEMKASVENNPFIHESISTLQLEYPQYDPLFFEDREIYQALLFCTEAEEQLYINKYKEFQFIRWHPVSTDIIPYGGSKAEGIKKMIDILSILEDRVYAFGDGLNDTEMLSFVGTGIAMGNAVNEIKEVADIVTKDVDNNGIEYGLKLVGLL
ncbi:Cof-type HAD-IIB family hydrolase [Ferdinandcohnia quinoae]|uniref:Cof-type HAD-IIB family hydrolase n=1 Tax=Fredinandcohnia quinoae TaxID=2918902 RepID=A0AAW5E592_9BACI|nr:Cof-type HAD-IIB family hydrolase [Fredinandcohnia sp. SECRCQ15]MCH1623949.1 Cof-type HAD-IIB family hydrolase [Fredinandcohnia sp. SECRCQ15]